MIRRFRELRSRSVCAVDGEVGSVEDLYFDDVEWLVHYFVVDTGRWLPGQIVLIPTVSVQGFDPRGPLNVRLTTSQVRSSPSVGLVDPISQRREEAIVQYYEWPGYWGPPMRLRPSKAAAEITRLLRNAHLQSADRICGYRIHARDGELGRVGGLVVDGANWRVRFLVVNLAHWLPAKNVVVSPERVEAIDWDTSTVRLNLTRQEIKARPRYRPDLAPLIEA